MVTKAWLAAVLLMACATDEASPEPEPPTCEEIGAPQLVHCNDQCQCSSFSCDADGVCTWNGMQCVTDPAPC